MPGCMLGVDPQIVVPRITDGFGNATLALPMTLPQSSFVVYAQAVNRVSSNLLGLGTTNVTRSVLGDQGLCNSIYNYSVDGPTAQTGPLPANRCIVLLFKP